MKSKKHIVLVLLVLSIQTINAQEHRYHTTSTLFTRAVSMGGAFTGVCDDLESALYNPAGLGGEATFERKFRVYLNPIGAAAVVNDRDYLTVREGDYKPQDWPALLGLMVRAVSFNSPFFQFSTILSEELPETFYATQSHFISAKNILDRNFHTASARITLASQVSIGASGFLFNVFEKGELKTFMGSSYGIMMRPSNSLSAGISYYNLPIQVDSTMIRQYRLSDKTINAGIAYSPLQPIRVSVDFRNVSEEGNMTHNELHAGIEVLPASFIALRGGYFSNANDRSQRYSFGIGLSDYRRYKSTSDAFVFSNFILNYGLQVREINSEFDFSHFLTFLFNF